MDKRVRKAVVAGMAVLSFLAPLKFTNPVVLYNVVHRPENGWEWLVVMWPNAVFYMLLIPLAMAGLWLAVRAQKMVQDKNGSSVEPRTSNFEHKTWLLPFFFLLVQLASAFGTVDGMLTQTVICLFCSLVAGYFFGAMFLKDGDDLRWVALGWLLGSVMVGLSGILQANGGLEETMRFLQVHPEWAQKHPQLWKWVESNRIFATFTSPNALGGYIASAVFILAAWCLSGKGRVVGGTVILMLLYCLWRSQSKGSYGVLFITVALAVLMLIQCRKTAWLVAGAVLILSLIGFGLGYGSHALEKGKKTLEARVGYWRAAWEIGRDHPILGSGPGTFAQMYPRYKRPEDEATVLVHNNYLQMWSDGGLLGLAAFVMWLPGTLWQWAWRWRRAPPPDRMVPTLLWCACVAFALHSLMDFDLYMISNAWPVFVLLGYLSQARPDK